MKALASMRGSGPGRPSNAWEGEGLRRSRRASWGFLAALAAGR